MRKCGILYVHLLMTQPLISIGIPTWNRYCHLKENIEQLLCEVAKAPTLAIEIFVSDNASTDETQSYCEDLQRRYPFFRYHRNATNLGANANFQNVITLSQGEYIWLLGDDDLIQENCLSAICDDIRRHHYPDIVVGGCLNDHSLKRLYPPFIEHSLLTDQALLAQYDAIKLAGKISVLIFKRHSLLPLLPKAWTAITTLQTPWPHLIWFILVLNQQGKLLCLPYGTNLFLEKNRYNMLQDGISRTNIMILEYAKLIQYLDRENLLTPHFYAVLNRSISQGRAAELLKIVAYTTYMNPYGKTIHNAWHVLKCLPGVYNKSHFALFYFLPVLFPKGLRKAMLAIPCFISPNRQAHRTFLAYLKKANALLAQKTASSRQVFDKEGL